MSPAVVIEIFAGSSRVTASLRKFGISSAFGVDHERSPKACAPVVIASLWTPAGLNLLYSWLKNKNVVGIFLTPPRNTRNRARTTLPQSRKRKFHHLTPEPLRSDANPNGRSNLSWADRAKVGRANRMYHLTANLCQFAITHGLIVCVANPQFSFMWKTSWWVNIAPLMQYTILHTCQFGSHRQGRTMLAHNHPMFNHLHRLCPGESKEHRHTPRGLPRGAFGAAEGTAYPFPLAACVAHVFANILLQHGLKPPPSALHDVQSTSLEVLQAVRATTGLQPKASRTAPFIPEFALVATLRDAPNNLPPNTTTRLTAPFVLATSTVRNFHLMQLPAEAKLLQSYATLTDQVNKGGEHVSVQVAPKPPQPHVPGSSTNVATQQHEEEQKWGIPWTPLEFVTQAHLMGHPCSLTSKIPTELASCIAVYNKIGAAARCPLRNAKIKYWLALAKELGPQEDSLRASMPVHLQKVLQGKRLALWGRLLHESQYKDLGVIDEMLAGAALVGDSLPSGLWPHKFTPATMTIQELERQSAAGREMALSQVVSSGDHQIDLAVWNQSLDEVTKGYLEGPFDPSNVAPDVPLSRRFGVVQGPKIRCIDDFSRSGVNKACQTHESPRPRTLDVLAGVTCELMHSAGVDRQWVARAFDLKDAYRQCGVHESSLKFSHIVAFCPHDRRPYVFKMCALPFGSVRSVHTFLRDAASIWHLAVTQLKILTTGYFDDYVTICEASEKENVTASMHMLLDLLGWRFARDGPKAPPFDKSVTALGVVVDVSFMGSGTVKILNTESRRLDMLHQLEEIIQSGSLKSHQALRLRGRMQFMAGQLFGRTVNTCLAKVTQHAYGGVGSKISADTKLALELFRDRLAKPGPRVLSVLSSDCWQVFTDASLESNRAGFGGVLVDPTGRVCEYFSFEFQEKLVAKLNPRSKKTCIFECEFFALYVALVIWHDKIRNAQVVFYLDNNAVRDTMICCHTNNAVAFKIMKQCLRLEDENHVRAWYNRVPSPSNIADWPSRLAENDLIDLGCKKVSCDAPLLLDEALA